MRATSSSNIHCPAKGCEKPILSQVALAEGSRFVLRCPSCKNFVKIITGFNHIEKRLLQDLHKTNIIKADEKTKKAGR